MTTIPLTLDNQVSEIKTKDISYRTLHSIGILMNEETEENIEIPYLSYVDKYLDFLKPIELIVKLNTNANRIRIRYNPKYASMLFYNTTEYWYLLLRLNECISTCEFGERELLKIYDPEKIKSYINEIMILEDLVS